MTGFRLRAIVREVLDTSNADHPAELAVEVYRLISAANRVEALRQALHEVVAVELTRARVTPGGQHGPDAQNYGAAGGHAQNVSRSRAALARQAWRAALRDRIHAGAGRFRKLADCGEVELLFAAAELRTHSARVVAKAETYETLAKHVADRGVAVVAELPDAVLAAVLSKDSPAGGHTKVDTQATRAAGRGKAAA
jgi:hypothetical protein